MNNYQLEEHYRHLLQHDEVAQYLLWEHYTVKSNTLLEDSSSTSRVSTSLTLEDLS